MLWHKKKVSLCNPFCSTPVLKLCDDNFVCSLTFVMTIASEPPLQLRAAGCRVYKHPPCHTYPITSVFAAVFIRVRVIPAVGTGSGVRDDPGELLVASHGSGVHSLGGLNPDPRFTSSPLKTIVPPTPRDGAVGGTIFLKSHDGFPC